MSDVLLEKHGHGSIYADKAGVVGDTEGSDSATTSTSVCGGSIHHSDSPMDSGQSEKGGR